MAALVFLRKHAGVKPGRILIGCLLVAALWNPAGVTAQASPIFSPLPIHCLRGEFCATSIPALVAPEGAHEQRIFAPTLPAHPLAACFVASRRWGFPFAWCEAA